MNVAPPDCTPKCRSVQHALDALSALTKGKEGQVKAFLSNHCHNVATLKDSFGRTALHFAASLGKRGVLDWLLDVKGADVLVKDKESGWTAMHRSVFYGHIDCLVSLVKHGSSLVAQDKEGLSVLDLMMKDRPSHVVFRNTDPTEVYTWGNNTNFTLGHGNQQSKHHPELVDLFPRIGIYIKQVVLCKFHSVFLSQKGQVYTCGHGQGGRLGHGDEQTYLVPRLVEGLISLHCSQVAAAKDHTVVLTEDGYVYTFGLNTFHQLGIAPPPATSNVPKLVQSKSLKGRTVIGVAAGRFHTVLWTKEAVYTVGLNGGQLGYLLDPNGERCVTAPRQVSALHHKDISISMAAASNGATVCVTEKGDVYLLTDYQCKKLASKQLNLKKVLVTGGFLDHRVDPQILREGGGEKMSILALDEAGRVFCWKSSSGSVKQCRWAYGRQVFMSDIALSKSGMMFITMEGEGFSGQWVADSKKIPDKRDDRTSLVNTAVTFCHTESSTILYEIPSVSSSSFSKDFHSLLAETDETDNIHDVTLQVDNRIFPAHKYILSMRSDYFQKHFYPESDRVGLPDILHLNEDAVGCDLFALEKVHPDMFEYLLQFIYTDNCDLLTHGYIPKISQVDNKKDCQDTLISSLQKISFHEGLKGKSAYKVYRSHQVNGDREKQKTKAKNVKKGKEASEEANPVKTLQGLAKKFGIASLATRLDGVKVENGRINVVHTKAGNRPKFNRKKSSYMSDVTLRSEDGKDFPCHKCVLCARLEYFRSMLGSCWIEASCCSALEMPIHSEILQVVLDYIYTDESPTIRESSHVEFLCNVLVVADQLLIRRLKEMCEVAITEKLTLKNAAELLEFAAMYYADQLKLSCLQFIVLNMAALLEARTLDVLSAEVLKELSAAYRRMIPAMQRRIITPYLDGPDLSCFEEGDGDTLLWSKTDADTEPVCRETLLKRAKIKAKKKPRRRSDSSGGYNLSDIIHSPTSRGLIKIGKTNSIESLQELLTSDSEGSCAGVGSPRELQSPVFMAGPGHDHSEMEEKSQVIETKSPTPSIKMKDQKASTPQSIQRPITSPTSPPVLDLRAFMEMEAHIQNCGATHKNSSGSGSKPTIHGTKISQKQRKMIAMSARVCNSGSRNGDSAPLKSGPSTSQSEKAWATPLHSSPSPKSFRDLLMEEEKTGRPVLSSLIVTKKVSFKDKEQHENEKTMSGPWLNPAVSSPPAVAPVTFAAIVEEERQQEAALIRSRDKPLALIQIEECAIQDLLIHYNAFDNPDEFIRVERASQGPIAIPMWNKH
ncbi:inhibitor of Bruton tyrosine kinase isoform X2 [Polyodon spathula]|uniref:inhibitor of Bruton tyrosine kinase isoform X2 n=1 Tax=Polyodon spathula TaxID=7913 RepID=UPI001B7E22E1|nr:inhibitor of Bruton tyrosine kinase isoform X2 [Polyodon spathula]